MKRKYQATRITEEEWKENVLDGIRNCFTKCFYTHKNQQDNYYEFVMCESMRKRKRKRIREREREREKEMMIM